MTEKNPPTFEQVERLIGETKGGLESVTSILTQSKAEAKTEMEKQTTLLSDIANTLKSINQAVGGNTAATAPGGKAIGGNYGNATQLATKAAGAGGANQPPTSPSSTANGGYFANLAAKFGGGSMGGGGTGGGGTGGGGFYGSATPFMAMEKIVGGLTTAIKAFSSSIDNRITGAYPNMLSADKMNVVYQQISGMSQQATQDAYRYPLTQYRLGGFGATNDMLSMQRTTGLSATGMAPTVEAMRALSGYSYGASDVTKMLTTLSSPQVANRMFMTMGTSMYGIGGRQNDPMALMQRAIQAAGLTDERVLAGARQQGSATRARLDFMGIPVDMQNDVIDYAASNINFRKKGGRGFYDPSKESDRRLMGIEENFSTQKEETDRLKALRDENLYNRQQDNYASLERQTQTLTKAFGALEEQLSGILGIMTSNRPIGKAIGSVLGGAGQMMMGLGSGLAMAGLVSNPVGWGIAGIGALGAIGSAVFGDPPENGKSGGDISVPTYGKPTTLSGLANMGSFKGMHPNMQERVKNLIAASGGRVGFGQGTRSSADQEKMFRERYRPTNKQTDVYWNNQYWEHVSGAPAAPPGRSMHEIGLAADLVGDMNWITANAAKFGLKNFADVNGEPWHVQPAELPNSRSKYEKSGATWGKGPTDAAPFNPNDSFGGSPDAVADGGEMADGGHLQGTSLGSLGGLSVKELVDLYSAANARLGGGNSEGGSGAGGLSYSSASNKTLNATSGGKVTIPADGKALSAKALISLLRAKGYSGTNLTNAVGITWRESGWNPNAFNGKGLDKSYGLFQINMKGSLGPDRRKKLGITSDEALFDPSINVDAARMIDPNFGWGPWSYSKPPNVQNPPWRDPINSPAAAASIISQTDKSGDPIPNESGRNGATTTTISGGTVINIAPQIYVTGAPVTADLEKVAREVGTLLRREVSLIDLRSN